MFCTSGQCLKPIDVRGATIAVSYSTTADVVTDLISEFEHTKHFSFGLTILLVMALPLNLLWNIRITNRQRFGLAVVFCVGVIIIVVAIVRAIFITTKVFKDGVLLTIWSIIESTVCKQHTLSLIPPPFAWDQWPLTLPYLTL